MLASEVRVIHSDGDHGKRGRRPRRGGRSRPPCGAAAPLIHRDQQCGFAARGGRERPPLLGQAGTTRSRTRSS